MGRVWASQALGALLVWLAYYPLSLLQQAKERDDTYYWLRIHLAVCAAIGAWDLARAARGPPGSAPLRRGRPRARRSWPPSPCPSRCRTGGIRRAWISTSRGRSSRCPRSVTGPAAFLRGARAAPAPSSPGTSPPCAGCPPWPDRAVILARDFAVPRDYAARVRLNEALVRGGPGDPRVEAAALRGPLPPRHAGAPRRDLRRAPGRRSTPGPTSAASTSPAIPRRVRRHLRGEPAAVVILGPGGLLGLPPGRAQPYLDVAWWRDLLVLAALAAAVVRGARAARRRPRVRGPLRGAGRRVLGGRPGAALRRARRPADDSLGGRRGGRGMERAAATASWSASRPRPASWTLLARACPARPRPPDPDPAARWWSCPRAASPSPFCGAGARRVWPRSSGSAGATGALDALRGIGFVPAPLVAAAGLPPLGGHGGRGARRRPPARARARGRRPRRARRARLDRCSAVGGPSSDLADTLWALTLDSHLWLVLGAVGLRRTRDPAARRARGGRSAAGPHARGRRSGRRLGGRRASAASASCSRRRRRSTRSRPGWPRELAEPSRRALARWGLVPERLPSAALVALVLAGGFLAWWDPVRTDPIARASLEPVPDTLIDAMRWLRTNTRARRGHPGRRRLRGRGPRPRRPPRPARPRPC